MYKGEYKQLRRLGRAIDWARSSTLGPLMKKEINLKKEEEKTFGD